MKRLAIAAVRGAPAEARTRRALPRRRPGPRRHRRPIACSRCCPTARRSSSRSISRGCARNPVVGDVATPRARPARRRRARARACRSSVPARRSPAPTPSCSRRTASAPRTPATITRARDRRPTSPARCGSPTTSSRSGPTSGSASSRRAPRSRGPHVRLAMPERRAAALREHAMPQGATGAVLRVTARLPFDARVALARQTGLEPRRRGCRCGATSSTTSRWSSTPTRSIPATHAGEGCGASGWRSTIRTRARRARRRPGGPRARRAEQPRRCAAGRRRARGSARSSSSVPRHLARVVERAGAMLRRRREAHRRARHAPAVRHHHRARRQVDRPPRAAVLAAVGRRRCACSGSATAPTTAGRRRRSPRSARRIERDGEALVIAGTGLDGMRAPARADRLRQLRHDDPPAVRPARRSAVRDDAGRRRVAVASGRCARDRAARADGRAIIGVGRRRHRRRSSSARRPARSRAIDYELPMASAQVKTAILLAGLYADGATTVTEPGPSRDHSERMLAYLGAPLVARTAGRPRSTPAAGTAGSPGDGFECRPIRRRRRSWSPRRCSPAPARSGCPASASTRRAPAFSTRSPRWAAGRARGPATDRARADRDARRARRARASCARPRSPATSRCARSTSCRCSR